MKRLFFLALALLLAHAAGAQEVRNPATLGTITGTISQSQLPSGYAAPTAHGVVIGEGTSAPVAVGPCGTAGQILGYPTTSADPQCVSQKSPIFASSATVAQNVTNYLVPGTTVVQANFNTGASTSAAAIVPYPGTFRNLRVIILGTIAAGQNAAYTLVTATSLGSAPTITALTCTIPAGASICTPPDTTHTVAVAAGTYWALQVVTSATSGATGQTFWSVEYDTP